MIGLLSVDRTEIRYHGKRAFAQIGEMMSPYGYGHWTLVWAIRALWRSTERPIRKDIQMGKTPFFASLWKAEKFFGRTNTLAKKHPSIFRVGAAALRR